MYLDFSLSPICQFTVFVFLRVCCVDGGGMTGVGCSPPGMDLFYFVLNGFLSVS